MYLNCTDSRECILYWLQTGWLTVRIQSAVGVNPAAGASTAPQYQTPSPGWSPAVSDPNPNSRLVFVQPGSHIQVGVLSVKDLVTVSILFRVKFLPVQSMPAQSLGLAWSRINQVQVNPVSTDLRVHIETLHSRYQILCPNQIPSPSLYTVAADELLSLKTHVCTYSG